MGRGRPGGGVSIHVAAIVEGLDVPRWQSWVLDSLADTPGLDLAAIAIDTRRRARPSVSERLHGAGYALYERLDRLGFKRDGDPFEHLDLADRHSAAPRMRLDDAGLERVEDLDLDVLVSFGPDESTALARAARHGCWALYHGDLEDYRGEPPQFWELNQDNRTFGTAIVAVRPEGRHVVYRSYAATDLVSLERGRAAAYWKTAHALVRRLTALRDGGWERIEAMPGFEPDPGPAKPPRGLPSNRQVLAHVARIGAGVARRRAIRAVLPERWFVAYRRRTGEPLCVGDGPPFTLLHSPPDREYADPFLIERDGRAFLFVEDIDRCTGNGRISCLCLDEPAGEPATVLERPYHLSYPSVFEHGGDVFMVPETEANGTVDLYRATSFPREWELVKTLLSGIRAVDPTIVEHDGRVWMFANVALPGASFLDELFVFSADSLTGDWVPHPLNPVVSDVRRARPAGRVVKKDGALFRLGQSSPRDYGDAITVNRIVELTETAYREQHIDTIGPGWMRRNLGTHGYSFSERYEAIDGRARRPRLPLFERAAERRRARGGATRAR